LLDNALTVVIRSANNSLDDETTFLLLIVRIV